MIEPLLSGEPFLADIASAGAGTHLWWLGQSGFLVQCGGRRLLLDPYLSDSLTQKYANTDKPHVRMTARVVDPGALRGIDVAVSTHNHTDHLDAETLMPVMAANPALRLIVPEANREFVAERLHCHPAFPIGLDDGVSVEVAGFRFTGVPSAHETVERDGAGRCRFLGFIVECGRRTIYHAGDTMLYDGLAERLERWRIDVALLPINGARPERRVAGNLDGREAACLAREIGARLVVPCHYEMFEFNTASPGEFAAECGRLGQRYRVLRCGERLLLD